MAFGSSVNASLAANAEAVWGTAVTTGAKAVRVTGFSFQPEFGTTESEEISSAHRETADLIRVSAKGMGSIDAEMSFDSFHPFMESVFGSAFATHTLKLGKTLKSVTLQAQYTDLTTAFEVYRGAVFNSWGLSVQIGQPIKTQFGFISKVPTAEVASVIGTVAAANTNPVMNPLDHISLIQEGGVTIDGCQSFELSVQNDLIEIPQLSSVNLAAVLLGRVRVTGTFSVFKQAMTRFSGVLSGAATTLALTIGETTRTYALTLPNVKIQNVTGGVSGSNPILERFTFSGLYNAADSSLKLVKGS